ncbi:MAG: methyltransferase domain-containing protein [Pyrinomonadaceae bacterium]
MKEKISDITPPYVRIFGPLTRPFPNFDFFFVKSLRRKAVELLKLKPGDRVLDAGCGSGASFPTLVQAVGSTGEVVGIEISPEFAINARKRIEKNGWKNVRVIEEPAQTAVLTGKFDALLMMAAPDVYASEDALANIFPYLSDNARVVVFGGKTSNSRLGVILNPVLRKILSRLSFPTTPIPDREPLKILSKRVENIKVEKDYFFGCMFLASGTVTAKK